MLRIKAGTFKESNIIMFYGWNLACPPLIFGADDRGQFIKPTRKGRF
jgi:hypothetical protein